MNRRDIGTHDHVPPIRPVGKDLPIPPVQGPRKSCCRDDLNTNLIFQALPGRGGVWDDFGKITKFGKLAPLSKRLLAGTIFGRVESWVAEPDTSTICHEISLSLAGIVPVNDRLFEVGIGRDGTRFWVVQRLGRAGNRGVEGPFRVTAAAGKCVDRRFQHRFSDQRIGGVEVSERLPERQCDGRHVGDRGWFQAVLEGGNRHFGRVETDQVGRVGSGPSGGGVLRRIADRL